VMALNDHVAIGIIRAFSENGIRVPDDIAVVGSENLPEGEFYYVPLTTIDFQIEKVAREVVDLFRRRLTGDWSDFPRKIVVSPKIVIRHSCGFSNKKQKEVCDEKEIMQ
ncbi:MAG: substrate-binding domain-containing protein, partial [Candidatus Omnitrophica bacterium]|nr:substrate-binding domain-containing protein [Candidatus Omnitrophota bacterium]